MIRILLFLLTMFIGGYYSGKLYSITEEDAIEQPWKYPEEPVNYIVWVKYKNQILRYEVKNYKQVLIIASKNPGAIIIYQAKQTGGMYGI